MVRRTWTVVAVLAVAVVYFGSIRVEASGRWKVDGSGGCYWDANDDGPDQCDPNAPAGRYTIGDDGTCYWDANDSGPNQCDPAIDQNGITSEVELIDIENMALEMQAEGGLSGDLPGAEVVLSNAVQYGYLLTENNPSYDPDEPPIPGEWKPLLIRALQTKITALERQRRIAYAAALAEIHFSRSMSALFGVLAGEIGSEINSLYWEIDRITGMECF